MPASSGRPLHIRRWPALDWAQASPVTGGLARFALAVIDGAFVACRADRGATLEQLLRTLTPSLAASRRALLGRRTEERRGIR